MEGHDTHIQNHHHHHHHNVDVLTEEQQLVQGGPAAARGGDGGSSSRWNPEKEQIHMLENFYRQGIRTPSAEQIQQITSRLRAYGHIEAKNVFYWFQNHKARLRQKQKQDSKAAAYHLTARARLLPIRPSHTNFPLAPPPPPPLPTNNLHPCPNVMCNPFYMSPESDVGGFYQHPQYPKVPLPAGVGPAKRRTRTLKPDKRRAAAAASASQYEPMHSTCQYEPMRNACTSGGGGMIDGNRDHETLPLFPLQPTGILQQEKCYHENPFSGSSSPHNSPLEIAGDHHPQPFYDFFSG